MIKIALVDDEVQILQMLEKFLSRNPNFDVTTYSNPVTASNAIISGSFDVVMLDIMMPQMDGMEVLEKIQASNANVSVIMMTAYSTLERVLDSHKIGASGYIMKPFENLASIESKIKEVYSKRG